MKTHSVKNIVLTLFLFILASPVLAHTGIGSTHGFADGLIHPLQGVDHLLVMLAIGFWACSRTGNKIWQLPLIFLLMMAAGAGIQLAGISMIYAEQAVALSVLVFGLIVGFNWRTSMIWATGLVAVFAFFHGYVHAAESYTGNDQVSYVSGFLLTTASLHGVGITFGVLSAKNHKWLRISYGIICTAIGVALCIG
jgi:urease accessory protein